MFASRTKYNNNNHFTLTDIPTGIQILAKTTSLMSCLVFTIKTDASTLVRKAFKYYNLYLFHYF